jgi:adenosine 3'-phospho 5'-phosphosulfate transporter B3
VVVFFLAMVLHEIALEAITAVYSLPPYNLPHIASSVTLFQFGFCVLLPFLLSLFSSNGDVVKNFPRTRGEVKIYVLLSVVVYGATAFATMSLSYEGITYVTKVIFKSAKLIPTMLVGVIIDSRAATLGRVVKNRKKYGMNDYASALLLSVGAAGFCMNASENEEGSESESGKMEDADALSNGNMSGHLIGLSLLTASVFCDALVPNIQEKLMHDAPSSKTSESSQSKGDDMEMKSLVRDDNGSQSTNSANKTGLSSLSLMVNTNAIGFALLLLSTILSSSLISIIRNAITHPHYCLLLLTVGVGLGTAVLSYTELIRRSGPATAVTVATMRKVVTVVLSYVIFPKPMSWTHLVSSGLVLLGLLVGFIGRGKK